MRFETTMVLNHVSKYVLIKSLTRNPANARIESMSPPEHHCELAASTCTRPCVHPPRVTSYCRHIPLASHADMESLHPAAFFRHLTLFGADVLDEDADIRDSACELCSGRIGKLSLPSVSLGPLSGLTFFLLFLLLEVERSERAASIFNP
jgi:hypothetical protein